MNRARWICWNATAAASALLFTATVALWIRSYGTSDQWWYWRGQRAKSVEKSLTLVSFPSLMWIGVYQTSVQLDRPEHPNHWQVKPYESGHILVFDGTTSRVLFGHVIYHADVADWHSVEYAGDEIRLTGLRFGWARSNRHGVRRRMLVVPYWFTSAVFALLPSWWIIRRGIQRRPIGRCRFCGYDLRATQDRCPECGKPAVRP